jgi:hypothetical protein
MSDEKAKALRFIPLLWKRGILSRLSYCRPLFAGCPRIGGLLGAANAKSLPHAKKERFSQTAARSKNLPSGKGNADA